MPRNLPTHLDAPGPVAATTDLLRSPRVRRPANRHYSVAQPAMCWVCVHARMPDRRYLELRRGKRKLEALKACCGGVVTHQGIAKARTWYECNQLRLARDPHGIRISGHDNHYSPSKTEVMQRSIDWLNYIPVA